MRRLLLLVPALLLVLSGCAATSKGGAAFTEASVEPGKALVYVYRHDSVSGEFTPMVAVSGARSFDLPNHSYAALNVAPGSQRIDVDWGKRSQLTPNSSSVKLEAGRTYYVRVSSGTHDGAMGKAVVFYMSDKTSLTVVERDEAMKSLPQTKSAF
jgi:hypothetical protein